VVSEEGSGRMDGFPTKNPASIRRNRKQENT